jgi:hypothetical protein
MVNVALYVKKHGVTLPQKDQQNESWMEKQTPNWNDFPKIDQKYKDIEAPVAPPKKEKAEDNCPDGNCPKPKSKIFQR